MVETKTIWTDKDRFVGEATSGHALVMDAGEVKTASTPMERLVAEPTPCEITSGAIPATSAMVVMRIGRKRSRFAWMMASYREKPCERRPLVWSI